MKLFCSLIALSLVSPALAAPPNALSAAEKSDGWKLLFDGSTLDGWRGYATEAIGAGWKVQDGAIVLTTAKSGDLMTVEDYGDFELALEWKATEAANSGIIYRIGLGERAAVRTGPEFQVLDNQKAKDSKIANHHAGSLYDLVAPPRDVTRPVGEWNEARIRVQGWKITHWLNGVKLLEIDLASDEGKALLAQSKFKDWPKFATLSRGHIALQDHGNVVSFRNLRIRER